MPLDFSHPYFPAQRAPIEREDDEEKEETGHPRTAADVQRVKLARLQRNIHKPAPIPKPKKEWQPPKPPEFVRNVVGSSAGAGSGEYHIYRNIRRHEYARRDHANALAARDEADTEWQAKFETHQKEAEERTARKRAKRLKKKAKAKKARKGKAGSQEKDDDDEDDDEDNEDDEEKEAAPGSSADDAKADSASPGPSAPEPAASKAGEEKPDTES